MQPGPRVAGADGVEIATHHLGGNGPPVMLAHATGFHGRCWIPMARTLTGSFAVWALDQRGHGSSGKAPSGRYDDWSVFVDDMLAVLDALGRQGEQWRGVGHSMGGAVLLMAEGRRPGTFANICCYEPIVFPPTFTTQTGAGFEGRVPLAELARKRRASFPSRDAAYDNFASKPPFGRFTPEALRAYVDYGFVDLPEGGVTLACAREDEASVFEGAPHNPAWDLAPAVRAPVLVMGGADADDPASQLVEVVARRLPRAGARRFDGLDHFGPFVDPERVGQVVQSALDGPGEPSARPGI